MTIIKNTNGFIFVGFISVPWSSSISFRTDSTAFLFTLTNPSGTPMKLKVNHPGRAVLHSSYLGPGFGDGADLVVNNESNTNRDSSMILNSYKFPNGKSGREGGQFIVGGEDQNQ